MPIYLERVLFVVAPQDSGKSTTLRSLFRDRRLGMNGEPPPAAGQRRIPEVYWLSNERRLYMRLTSPHEVGETVDQFIEKTHDKMAGGRWCFAGPLQPDAFGEMPDVVETVRNFIDGLSPERVRVAFLSPTRHGVVVGEYSQGRDLIDELNGLPGVEVICIDGRRRGVNGLLLADFLDFT
jgi:hypothetical protein